MAEEVSVRQMILSKLEELKKILEQSSRGRLPKQYIAGSRELGTFVELVRDALGPKLSRRELCARMKAASGSPDSIHEVTLYRVAKGELGLDLPKLEALIKLVTDQEEINPSVTYEQVEAATLALTTNTRAVETASEIDRPLNRTVLRVLSERETDPPLGLLNWFLEIESSMGMVLDEELVHTLLKRWDAK